MIEPENAHKRVDKIGNQPSHQEGSRSGGLRVFLFWHTIKVVADIRTKQNRKTSVPVNFAPVEEVGKVIV